MTASIMDKSPIEGAASARQDHLKEIALLVDREIASFRIHPENMDNAIAAIYHAKIRGYIAAHPDLDQQASQALMDYARSIEKFATDSQTYIK